MSSGDNSGNPGENVPAIEGQRQPRNLQDLLRYAVEAGGNSAQNNNVTSPLDPERRRFLEEALRSMTVDLAKELTDAISVIKTLMKPESDHASVSECEEALDKIADFVDNIDAANDYYKLGGFDIIGLCLTHHMPTIRWKMADIIGLCAQNNPFIQSQAVALNLVRPLLNMVDQDAEVNCKVKAFFAVAAIVRDCPPALKQFIDADGFSVVLRGMESPFEKLRIKTTFFLSSMIGINPEIKEVLFKMGFVEQLIGLLREEHSPNHEHLTSTLLSLVENYEEAQQECRRPEFELKAILKNLLDEHSGNEAYQEEMTYVRNLIEMIFSDDHEEER